MMIRQVVKYNENRALAALRALGKNKDYTVSEQPAAKGMVIFINGVPVIPIVATPIQQTIKQQHAPEPKVNADQGNC